VDNLLKYAAMVGGAIAGVIALFSFMGFLIVLSFVNQLELYGIPKFPQEFFQEAVTQLLRDFADDVIAKPGPLVAFLLMWGLCFGFLFVVRRGLNQERSETVGPALASSHGEAPHAGLWTLLRDQIRRDARRGRLALALLACLVVLVLVIKTTELGPRVFLVLLPMFIALGTYLTLYVSDLTRPDGPTEWQKNCYLLVLLACLVLVVAIPVSYGRNVYDFPVYSVTGFEYEESYKSELAEELRRTISAPPSSRMVYVLMGHTSGKEVFFRSDESPWRMILIDANAVRMLRVGPEPSHLTLRTAIRRDELGGLGGKDLLDEDRRKWSDLVKGQ
jgi:hypothetical protein